MNVAVVHWLVNDVGGINSWTENFILGLKKLGCKPTLFYSTHQNRLNCDPATKVNRGRYHLLPAEHLPYTDKEVSNSISRLNQFDVIVFAHPSPHPVKATVNSPWVKGWQRLYTDTKPFNISVFHDRHWDRTNAWMADVRDSVGYAHAAQHHFVDALERFNAKSWGWSLFPLVVNIKMPVVAKERRVVWATQWLAIKNHRYLVPHLLKLKVPVSSFGGGQVYHKLQPEMKLTYGKDWHTGSPVTYNPKSPHVHYGHVEYRELLNTMSKSWFSLDMSIQGMTNMTHWEPMTVGAVSVMEQRVVNDKYCEIPKECCLSFSLDNVVSDLNRIVAMPESTLLKIQKEAFELVKKCECSKVTQQILEQAGLV